MDDGPAPPEGPPDGQRSGRALRITLWILGVSIVLAGFAVVGFFVLAAASLSQWASNK